MPQKTARPLSLFRSLNKQLFTVYHWFPPYNLQPSSPSDYYRTQNTETTQLNPNNSVCTLSCLVTDGHVVHNLPSEWILRIFNLDGWEGLAFCSGTGGWHGHSALKWIWLLTANQRIAGSSPAKVKDIAEAIIWNLQYPHVSRAEGPGMDS